MVSAAALLWTIVSKHLSLARTKSYKCNRL